MAWSGYLFLFGWVAFLAAIATALAALVAATALTISSPDRRSRKSNARKRGGGIIELLFKSNPNPGPPTDSESESVASSTTSKLQPKLVLLLPTPAGPLSVVVTTFLGATENVMSSPLGSAPT